MYSVRVRDHMMIAHSFKGEVFGPAQRLHGATYVVEASLSADRLDSHGVVADIGALARELRAVLADLELRNLDDDPSLEGVNTTTEVLARTVADRLAARLEAGDLGAETDHVRQVAVVLRESDVAWAAYRRDVGGPS